MTTVDFVARMGRVQDRNGAVTEKMTVETGAMRLDVVSHATLRVHFLSHQFKT